MMCSKTLDLKRRDATAMTNAILMGIVVTTHQQPTGARWRITTKKENSEEIRGRVYLFASDFDTRSTKW